MSDQARLLAALGLILYLVHPAAAVDSPAAPSVRAEFEAICQAIRDSEDPFYGQGRARELARQLASPPADPAEAAVLRAALGRELLKLGDTTEAIALLGAALATAETTGFNQSVRFDILTYLGLAHLQAAEDENCLARHTAASCILPFAEEGIHRLPAHSRKAGDAFLKLARESGGVQAVWLLNLARMVSGDFPDGVPEAMRLPPAALTSALPFPRWRDRAPELGIAVVDLAGGAVMDDFDGDGLLDLLTSTWDPCGSLKAFRNDGRGGFEEVTRAWGLDQQLGGLNLVHGDYDNDGRLDLLVLRGGWMGGLGRIRNSLLNNQLGGPGGRFVDVTRASGLAEPAYPTQTAAWADYDGDGDLDLYVGNEDPDGRSYPSQLFRNNRDGTFTDVAREAGVQNFRFAKGVAWGDYDGDGDPDLYVSNSGPNRLYRNHGPGPDGAVTFTDVAPDLGVTEPEGRSFVPWFFDFDNDGDLDLFVADYASPVPAVAAFYFGVVPVPNRPHLYRNQGGRFTEVSRELGLARPLLPMGANYGDLDNDGWLDFYLGTGEPGYETVMPNVMFRNRRGLGFEDVTFAGGFGHLQKGHGVAFGDLDNDGDQDLLHQLGGFFPGDAYANALFENPGPGASWVTLRLVGTQANRFGVGARIAAVIEEGGALRTVHALAGSGGSFGGSSLQQEIGLGRAARIRELTIRWPGSGTVQRFTDLAVDRVYRVVEGQAELEVIALSPIRLGGPGGHAGH